MSSQITVAHSEQYASNVELLLQQKQSRLRGSVRSNSYTGKSAQPVQQIGSITLADWVREGDTPILNTPHDVRWLEPTTKHGAQLIDRHDFMRTIADFRSPYVETGASAANRAIDEVVISAAFGTSKTGEDKGTEVAWSTFTGANASHLVDSSGVTGMTVAKLRSAKKALMAAEVDIDNEELFVVMGSSQHDDLLGETLAASADYNTTPVLVDGRIRSFMGFNFITTELLPTTAGADRRCFAFARSGLALGIFGDVTGRVSERDDKSYATQVYTSVTVGATRVEEKKQVEVVCGE
jgi:hypothetical protein|tara:strand:- start:2156 stop:3040 length:885 start_codon:yes stop_codon:yes gene_type:complete